MNLDNNKIALAFLSIVVIASGCSHTGGPDTDSGPTSSVAIQNFSAFPQNPYNNQETRLRLQVKNLGDRNAEAVWAKLGNVPFSGENSWKQPNGDNIERWEEIGDLEAADEANDIPARSRKVSWEMKAPDIDNNLEIPYDFWSRIYYKYKTVGTSEITLMTNERFKQEGPGGTPTLQNTAGPIKMDINTQTPIVYDKESQSRMCVSVRNNGAGDAFLWEEPGSSDKYTLNDENRNKIEIRVPSSGRVSFTPESEEVTLIGGGNQIECFTIEVPENVNQERFNVPIQIEAVYGYTKKASETVTVRGSARFDEEGE